MSTSITHSVAANSKAASAKPQWLRQHKKLVYGLSGLVVLVGLWSLGIRFLASGLPLAESLAPGVTFQSLYELLVTGQLTTHSFESLQRVLVGLGLALLIGVPVGLAVGASRLLENMSSTAFQFLRMISPLSWMPIAVMAFGIGDAPIYFLLTFAAVWPIMLNTIAGVKQLDPKWLMLAKSLSATRSEILFRIIVPGILGNVLTGVRLAIGIIWIVLVPCEMLGVSSIGDAVSGRLKELAAEKDALTGMIMGS